MQIFKRIRNNSKRAQNLIEFMFILPILIFLTLAIFEVAFFWQDVNAVYNLNAEINANLALIDPQGMSLGDRCVAANRAFDILKKRDSMISLSSETYNTDPTIVDGDEPFSLYEYTSTNTVTGTGKPQIALWVDCRNPFEDGITTQLEFFHKTLIMKASIPRFASAKGDTSAIVIIPDTIFIASPKLNTLRHY